jgi:hypothetical protein
MEKEVERLVRRDPLPRDTIHIEYIQLISRPFAHETAKNEPKEETVGANSPGLPN